MTGHTPDHGDAHRDPGASMHHGSMDHGHQPAPASGKTKDPPTLGGHNQMMVGTNTIYLSHLPMFMFDPERHEHSFQVILEVALSGPSNPQAKYAADRRKHPDVRMYTMQPAAFEMVELDPRTNPRRHTLTGTIFRGHLERESEVIIDAAVAEVVNIVYYNRLEENAAPSAELGYLLFGKRPELFVAHLLTRPPDFDQILSVTLSDGSVSDEDFRRGIRITIPGRANTPRTRIKAGERVTGHVQRAGGQAKQPAALQLAAGTEFYFEEGELGDPALAKGPGAFTMKQTPEEKAAGF